jgi:hypothetical protein
VASVLNDGKLLIVANASLNPNAIEEYGLRWEIETLFGCLKGRGFNLEDTRVVGYLRMKKLFVLPVIAFCWSHKVGEWEDDCVVSIKTKIHQRLAQSIFRYGLDCIRSELFNVFSLSKKQVRKILSLLRPALSGNRIYRESEVGNNLLALFHSFLSRSFRNSDSV